MSVKSGQVVTVDFTTANPTTGAAADASSLPTATLVVNGTDNAATVTVTNKATGVYKAAVTLPTLTAGDVVSIRVAATVATVAGVGVVWTDVADTKRVSDLRDEAMRGTDGALTDKTGFSLTTAYDHAKDDVLTPLAVVDGNVDKLFDGTGEMSLKSVVVDNSAGTYGVSITGGVHGALIQAVADSGDGMRILGGKNGTGLYSYTAGGGDKARLGTITGSLSGAVGSVTGAVGSVTAAVTTANAADVTAILEDTATTIPAALAAIDGKVDAVDGVADAILVDTGTTIPATLATILEDTATTIPAQIAATDAKVDIVDGILDTTLPLIQRIYRYFFNKRTHTNSSVVVYADDGVTADATMVVSGDTTTVTKAAPS